MKSPAFQFYPNDFLTDENVVVMTNEEVGCYMKLVCYCWKEGTIPSDISKLSRLCGVDSTAMAQLWLAIQPCFSESQGEPGRMLHPRLEKEREKQEEHRAERSNAGTKGAKSRWRNKKHRMAKPSNKNGTAIVQPMAKHSSSSSSSSSSSDISIPAGETPKLILESPEPEINKTEMAQEIFALFPRKDGKAEAINQILNAFKIVPPLELRMKVGAFAKAVAQWPQDQKQFVPWCERWMKKKRWLDDPATWVRTEAISIPAIMAQIRTKEARMQQLKKASYADSAGYFGGQPYAAGWRDETAKAEYQKLSAEVKDLNKKVSEQ